MDNHLTQASKFCIFEISIAVFKDFSRLFIPMIIFKAFQGLENFCIKFQDFSYFSRICMNPENTQTYAF